MGMKDFAFYKILKKINSTVNEHLTLSLKYDMPQVTFIIYSKALKETMDECEKKEQSISLTRLLSYFIRYYLVEQWKFHIYCVRSDEEMLHEYVYFIFRHSIIVPYLYSKRQ